MAAPIQSSVLAIKDKKTLIYLADTVHTSGQLSPDTVPYNVARIAAFTQARHPDHEYVLFKNPHSLLEVLRHRRPDILGLSHYFWNSRLNHKIARYVRSLYPDTVIVTGGPSLDRNRAAYEQYATTHPYIDFVVVEEGETTFEGLVAALSSSIDREKVTGIDVPGTFGILGPGEIHLSASRPRTRSLDEFPSPYLNGMLDPFLAEGLRPIIETVRGCPYQCAFCEQGSSFFTKLAKLSEARVFDEVEYIRTRTSSPQLIVADVNFGIIKRDLDVARFLKASHERHGWPSNIYVYNAKQPTETTLEVMETLYPMAQLSMSFQSIDEGVLENIHRSNIGYDKYSFITRWAKSRGLPVGTELIYGLPGETRTSFVKGYETLLDFNADYMASYNLRLFPGIELNTPEKRGDFSVETRFRPMDINLGEYVFETSERILEVEEIVLSTGTLSEDDFFYTRRLAFLVEVLWNTGYLRPSLAFLSRQGFKVMGVIEAILDRGQHSSASSFFAEYDRLARDELVRDPDEFSRRCLNDNYWSDMANGRGVNVKLNLAFAGKLMLFDNDFDAFFYDFLESEYGPQLPNSLRAIFADTLVHCRASKVNLDHPEPRFAQLEFDVPEWVRATYPVDLEPYRLASPETYAYTLDEAVLTSANQTRKRLEAVGASANSIAERIIMEVPAMKRGMRPAVRLASQPNLGAEHNQSALQQRMNWGG